MIIAGTGHRPDKLPVPGVEPYSVAHLDRLTEFAMHALLEYPDLRKVLSGMAQGWDMALARAAIKLGIPLHAAVPFKGFEARWPTDAQRMYHLTLGQAQHVTIVSPGGFTAHKLQVRNEFLVKQSYLLLALWDGTSGGTANCLDFAAEWGREHRNLWPDWQAHLKETA